MAHLVKLIAVASLTLGFTSTEQGSISDAELSDALVSIITDNGLPCAKVLDVRAMDTADLFEVTCTERAGFERAVRYIMNMRDGTAVRA